MDKKKALSDIHTIKEILVKNQTTYRSLGQLLMLVGGVRLLDLVLSLLLLTFQPSLQAAAAGKNLIEGLAYAALLYFLVKITKKEQKSRNDFYLFTLYSLLTVVLVLPILFLLVRLASSVFPVQQDIFQFFTLLDQLSVFLHVVLFSGFLFLYGSISQRKSCQLGSLLHLLLYLLLLAFGQEIFLGDSSVVTSFSQLYYGLIVSVGYCWLGFRFIRHHEAESWN